MTGAKPCKTPMQQGQQLSRLSGTCLSDATEYRMTMGALQYVTITRPNITFAVNKVSKFMSTPTDQHWLAVKRILRYLAGSTDKGLKFQHSTSLSLNAFTDADWVGCPDDRKSTTDFGIFLGPNLISWSSKKQATISRSSTEAEYRSLAMTTTELLWINSLLSELGIKCNSLPVMWCDNLGAMFLTVNPIFHARTKHIEIDFHFIRDQIAKQKLVAKFICSADQIGDIFTKSLSSTRFQHLCNKFTLSVRPFSLRGCRSIIKNVTGYIQ
jgi:hypothetical protein